ncbi:uncharacterized protein LOC112092020 [Morus notabilis]|uniref:uncharacterized protein LOC112092020 n=1 Tax=Morus notabilis TaxID=981085 RepID=UPI000CED349F|nr:uncharacterized protein LOC112092020 [Morus notabilis]
MKDLGPLHYFLGIEVASSLKGYLLSQSKYIAIIFERARLTDNKTVDTPLELNALYSFFDGSLLLDPSLYRTVVGSSVYLIIIRPDVAHVVHVVNQFVTSSTTVHWAVVLRILIRSDAQALGRSDARTLGCSNIRTLEHSDVRMLGHSDAQAIGCSDTRMLGCSNAQLISVRTLHSHVA